MITVYYRYDSAAGFQTTLGIHHGFDPKSWQSVQADSSACVYDNSGSVGVYTQAELDTMAAQEKLVEDAKALGQKLELNSMPRIDRAIKLGKTTNSTPDVVAFYDTLNAVWDIARGIDTTSTTLPTIIFPANT